MTMKLQVLGTGCPKCRLLTEQAERAARELGIDFELEKVTELAQILEFGIVATPALVVDGEVLISGSVPTLQRLKESLAGTGIAAT